MRLSSPFLLVIPLIASLFLIIRGYIIFLVIVVPKYVSIFGANANPFVELELYFNYPIYFIVSVTILLLLTVLIFVLVVRKSNVNIHLISIIGFILAIYLVNLNNTLTGALTYKVLYDISEHDNEVRMIKNVDRYRQCGCMECIQNCTK
jgi:hypothetical protein